MSTNKTATKDAIIPVPPLPWYIVERILKFQSTKDLKNCRLVCYNWLCMVDVYIGVAVKLNSSNKAKLFASALIRSCTKLTIYKSAGLLNWYVCFFSPSNLKSVDILENILYDNWQLLLKQCKGIQLLTIVPYVQSYNRKTKVIATKENTFDFKADITEKIDHCSLRRLFFKVNYTYTFGIGDIENGQGNYTSMANMINTIGIAPQLRQIVIVLPNIEDNLFANDEILYTSVQSLMQLNPGINSFGSVEQCSSFQDVKMWDKFLEQNWSCLAYTADFEFDSESWTQVSNRLLNVGTLYHGNTTSENWPDACTLINNITRRSRNLTSLYLTLSDPYFTSWVLDCNLIVQCLQNLKNLTLRLFHSAFNLSPTLQNFNVLSDHNVLLQYLDISLHLTEENLTTIFSIPKLEELHIRLQKSSAAIKEHHFEQIGNHPKLKIIFWEKKFQKKWNRFDNVNMRHNWEHMKMNPKNLLEVRYHAQLPVVLNALDDGYFTLKSWKKKFSRTFALFNRERITDSDRARLREDY